MRLFMATLLSGYAAFRGNDTIGVSIFPWQRYYQQTANGGNATERVKDSLKNLTLKFNVIAKSETGSSSLYISTLCLIVIQSKIYHISMYDVLKMFC